MLLLWSSSWNVSIFGPTYCSCAYHLKSCYNVHIAGVGDYPSADATLSADLCPLPPVDGNEKQRQINIERSDIDKEPHLEIETVTNHDPCQPILEPVSILGTADVLDFNPTSKKIKPTGTPSLILNETALMRDMLMSDNEVTDVKIKTAHGIDGEVIKVIGAYNGTTYIAVINKTGLYFIVDGLSYLLIDTDTPEKIRNITREKPHKLNCPKLFQLGKEMLASVQGSNFWSNHILDVIKPKVEKYKGWRLPKQCAEETHRILKEHVFTEDDLVKQGFPKDYDMSKAGCGIVFGAYIDDQEKGRVPSMYYADRYNCLEVIDADRYDGTIAKINDNDKIRVGYICRGSGLGKCYNDFLTIENGNLTEDEHASALLRAMREAKEDPLTGGLFVSKHISPTGITDLHPMVCEDCLDTAIDDLESKVRPRIVM
ncbi:hypothetical protein MKX03_025830 [Papaver bracteatum]|nr:hypothetical protein MKX03_025830 [Papaver bracteatum]